MTGKTGYCPDSIYFEDASSGSESVLWEWDFGDGRISDEKNPVHIYAVEGIYTVSLTVWNEEGEQDTKTKSNYITIVDLDKAEFELYNQGIYGRGTYHLVNLPEGKKIFEKESITRIFEKESI